MKNIIIRVIVSIIVLIFVFSSGIWAGLSLTPMRKYFIDNGSSSSDVSSTQEEQS